MPINQEFGVRGRELQELRQYNDAEALVLDLKKQVEQEYAGIPGDNDPERREHRGGPSGHRSYNEVPSRRMTR